MRIDVPIGHPSAGLERCQRWDLKTGRRLPGWRRAMMLATPVHWFIDASNVIGSRPDGWWRDRDGAARRLIDEVRSWAEEETTVVLDAGPDELLGTVGNVTVVRARRSGRDAADDEILELVHGREDALVVTSDAELARHARALGADVLGAGEFRRRLASSR